MGKGVGGCFWALFLLPICIYIIINGQKIRFAEKIELVYELSRTTSLEPLDILMLKNTVAHTYISY